jgi:predicted permease
MMMEIWGVMAPVLFTVLVGLGWGRLGVPFDTDMVSRLVMYVGAPCLIIATLSDVRLSLTALAQVGWIFLCVLLVTSVLALVQIRLAGGSPRVFFSALVFPNVGNMGLPVCLLAFGQQGLALALAWFMLNSVAHFSLGLAIVSGESVWRELIRNPVVIAVVVALSMLLADIKPAGWLQDSLSLAGQLTIPLMLITLGVSLSRLRVTHLRAGVLFAVLRLVTGFSVAWLVCELAGIEGVLRAVVITQSSMPVAVFNYLFAARYRQGPEEVASMVVVSTVLAFLLLPLLLGGLLGT